MDSEENYSIKSSMKVQFKKRVSKRHKSTSTSTDSDSDKEKNIKYKKSKSRIKAHIKKTLHSHKHKHKKRRSRSSSSDSSSSVDSSTSSSTEINSSSTSEEERKRRKKINKRLLKKRMKKTKKNASSKIDEGSSNDIPLELMSGGRSLTPMTKEEWEKKQSVVRRVYDETTGRNRLIKGDGEVIEEIVSRERHKQINEQATKGDGDFFQKHLKKM